MLLYYNVSDDRSRLSVSLAKILVGSVKAILSKVRELRNPMEVEILD